ncbi:unnamed protein product [Blepharisma stoltei]|uniref:Uncharacterized protein n=1 Tax=Blepharisma stoltei TaxID=1481888 RepID=A0AAU9J1T5_9CILI|nr:unnamed protein product [Blepharisma stoltei]
MSLQAGTNELILNFDRPEHPLVQRIKFDLRDLSPPMAVGDKFQPSHGKINKIQTEKNLSFKEFAEFRMTQKEIQVSKA